MTKVAVYSIALNERNFVDRWYASAAEADYVILADTGSTDGTLEHAASLGVQARLIRVDPWRFDTAKNMALEMVPNDVDVCVSLDMDEILLPGWRKELEKHWEPDARIANHRYRNNSNPWQWHSKIHNRKGCRWVGAVHETLEWSIPDKALWISEIYLDEKQDIAKDRSKYIELLHVKIDEGDRDWKTFYFLANEYMSRGDIESSIKYRTQSLELCHDGGVSRSYVAKNIAMNYQTLNNFEEAIHWFDNAVAESNERESWYAYAMLFYMLEDWENCLEKAERCLQVTEQRNGYTFDPRAWSESPYDLAALSSYNCQRYEDAVRYGKQALEMRPDDIRLQQNLKFYEAKWETT